ncbi:MAG: ribose-phosphate pyrophosphokinase [Eggerthellaceae bacterium]|nr:ribose-phosphate pyrophosphokinase [Eggerthellaceae bacterium]
MTDMTKTIQVFSGSVHPAIVEDIVESLGIGMGRIHLERFANGEIYAQFVETIRGADVFLVQSIAGEHLNDALMELMIMVDAAKRASARNITAVLPYYAYGRQDRKACPREPITAKLVADLLQASGIDRLISVDLHQGQIQGFFDIPVNHLSAVPLIAEYYKKKDFHGEQLCVVSPDVGRAKAAKKLSNMLENADLAIMHKGRPEHNKAEIMALIGDVEGKICLLNDDMIDTAGSICAAAETLKKRGAKEIYLSTTHPILSLPAYDRLEAVPIEELLVCNTIPVDETRLKGKLKILNISKLLADAIDRVYNNGSISTMFEEDFNL